jgi:hypothetical protein
MIPMNVRIRISDYDPFRLLSTPLEEAIIAQKQIVMT